MPSGTVVKEEKSTQKLSTTSLQAPSSKKQPAPPPPPPSPPYCPTPDYDTASLASQMTSDDNNKVRLKRHRVFSYNGTVETVFYL